MPLKQTFRAKLESAGASGGAFVTVPFDVEQVYGKKRVKVKALIGGVPYRGSLVRMGSECHILPVLKEIRTQLGKAIGDEIECEVEEDTELRQVEVPADLQAALADHPAAEARFNKLAYTHRREYVRWIAEAKRAETRARRIAQTVAKLAEAG
jgi:hypothetical protein